MNEIKINFLKQIKIFILIFESKMSFYIPDEFILHIKKVLFSNSMICSQMCLTEENIISGKYNSDLQKYCLILNGSIINTMIKILKIILSMKTMLNLTLLKAILKILHVFQ